MIIYLAGPMSGHPQHNFAAFDAAKAVLEAGGHCVISPADLSRGLDVVSHSGEIKASIDKNCYARCMRIDIQAILMCDALVMLPGWTRSRGAKLEVHIAQTLCIPVMNFETMDEVQELVVTSI